MSVNYNYDPDAAGKADNIANRIDKSDAYIGQIKVAHHIEAGTGTTGIHFEFSSPQGGNAGFDLYTHKSDGSTTAPGWPLVNALMAILGLPGLRSVPGKFEAYDFDEGKRVEKEGEVFPDLCNKDIGLVLQKELYNRKSDGKESYRMNLQAVFHPVSRFTASELKERKATPEKLEKIMRGLKDKDNRKEQHAEPAHPVVGGVEGSF